MYIFLSLHDQFVVSLQNQIKINTDHGFSRLNLPLLIKKSKTKTIHITLIYLKLAITNMHTKPYTTVTMSFLTIKILFAKH